VKLSSVQKETLRTIVDRYDRAVQSEHKRWGEESARFVADKGVEISGVDYRTLHALENRGLIRLRYSKTHGETLRRGAFGRWIGGTRKYEGTIFFAAPTDLGRRTAA
jgi:hypothetical protein